MKRCCVRSYSLSPSTFCTLLSSPDLHQARVLADTSPAHTPSQALELTDGAPYFAAGKSNGWGSTAARCARLHRACVSPKNLKRVPDPDAHRLPSRTTHTSPAHVSCRRDFIGDPLDSRCKSRSVGDASTAWLFPIQAAANMLAQQPDPKQPEGVGQ